LPPDFDAFAARGVDPETFHLESLDRFQPLADVCSPQQINRFDSIEQIMVQRVASLPLPEIATTLEGLYRQAYIYNEEDRTMAAGTSPAHQEAKRRLDLWIAAIDQRAFQDSDFSERAGGEKRIRTVMALNSPHLNPIDRGDVEQMFHSEKGGDETLIRLLRERSMEGWVRQFDWLKVYDGKREKFFEDPLFLSQTEMFGALESHFDRDHLLRLFEVAFPRDAMEGFLDQRGYGDLYRRLLSLNDEALIQNYFEVSVALTPQTRPVSRRRLVEEMTVMSVVFEQRGLYPTKELERRSIESMVRMGYPREDAELILRLQTGSAQYTYDRLDDYRARHGLLKAYGTLYREMLTRPLEDVFSPKNLGRYGTWGATVLNRTFSKVPVFLSDLDSVRAQIRAEVGPSMLPKSRLMGFEFRDPARPQWFTPSDLGFCHAPTGGPMGTAGLVTFGGRSAEDLICSNVELMAFLPESLHLDHALGTAIGVFGVITMRGMNSESDGRRNWNAEWAPGALLDVLTHEATHMDWFRTNFDRDAQRLTMFALNERQAYATGAGYLQQYFLNGLSLPGEKAGAEQTFRFIDDLIAVVNDDAGLSPGNKTPDHWEHHWDTEPSWRFAYQPPMMLQSRRSREMLDARFGVTSAAKLDSQWNALVGKALLRLSPAERQAAREGMARVSQPSNNSDTPVYFLASHPLTRVVNDLRAGMGVPPLSSLDVTADEWQTVKYSMAQSAIDSVHLKALYSLAKQKSH